jgi:hypothetical protein
VTRDGDRFGFYPDGEGLHEAVDRLIEADGPFDDPPVPQGEAIGLPPYLPEQGLGERAALKRLARPVLSSAAPPLPSFREAPAPQ